MKYLALIQGGLGPDVWDAKQAVGKAEIYGGTVTELEQSI